METMLEDWPLLLYLAVLTFVLVSLLCGDWPIFHRTPVRSLNRWLSGGACDCLQEILRRLFGARGVRSYEYAEHICCERSNPILQIFYMSIISGAFAAFYFTSFKFIPGAYVSSLHRVTGPLAVVVGVIIFALTCLSDPGTITPSNLKSHRDSYPFDGVLFVEKICSTCKIPRPARSKHCSICNRCIARFDHHCGWMNTCIGANNLRYFLLFLIWNCILCLYGAAVLVAILAGEVKKHKVMQRISFYYGMGTLYDKFPYLLQWLLAFYNHQILLMLFLIVVSILLAAFLAYHCYLISRNTTTNEVYKWDMYKSFVEETQQAEQQETQNSKPAKRWSCGFWRTQKHPVILRNNIYHRGALSNFCEVLWPLERRRNKRLWNKKE